MPDQSTALAETVAQACATGRQLYITGGNSKSGLLGRRCDADTLSVAGHTGVVDYHPGELVLTARAGTPIAELNALLAAEGQCLSCETPDFAGRATLGGSLACNLSGPARPWSGALRDLVLGVRLINGKGEQLRFGGQVMKNVAGYDVSRLQAGALGTLGVITEVSLKVMPQPEHCLTLAYEMPVREALARMLRHAAEPRPLTGACWFDGRLYLRLAGARAAVAHTAQHWGGEQLPGDTPWNALRETAVSLFDGDAPLYRISLAPHSELGLEADGLMLDWGGAQRWVPAENGGAELAMAATAAGGHAWLYRGGDRSAETAPALAPALQALHQRVKQALDPAAVLNPGRLYSWL